MELDRVRAAGAQFISGITTTTGNEPLIVDLPLSQKPDEHWIVELAAFKANLTVKQPNTAPSFPPLTGLFLVPLTAPVETLAEAAAGWNQNARYLLLPMGPPGAAVGTIVAGPPFAFAMTLAAGFKMTVPFGFTLRAIVVCDAGNAAPGPGAGSVGTLTVLAYRERNTDPLECA